MNTWRLNMLLLVGLESRLAEDAEWVEVVDLLDSNMQQRKKQKHFWSMVDVRARDQPGTFRTNTVPVRFN